MLYFNPHPGARTETLGAVTASSRGTLITASATANAKGTAVSLGTTAFAYDHVVVSIAAHSAAADYLVDVSALDPASGGYVLLPDLHSGTRLVARANGISLALPLRVGSGVALFARCSCSTGSSTCAVSVAGFSSGLQGVPGFGRAVALFTPASSRGTAVAATTVTTTLTQLSAGVAQRVGAVFVLIGDFATQTGANASTARLWQGPSGAQQPVIDPMPGGAGANIFLSPKSGGPAPCDIPPSTPVWANLASSLTGTADVAAYGLVA
jgi:hypothetical protein